jgi:hypothetical protein
MKKAYEICKSCYITWCIELRKNSGIKKNSKSYVEKHFNRFWNDGGYLCKIDTNVGDEVPKECPYYLEHVVK